MTHVRRTASRGALLLALMAGSPALLGGMAYAGGLGDTSPVPLPAVPVTVPLLGGSSPSPSPSPSPTATASTTAQQDATAFSGTDSGGSTPTTADQPVAATSDSAPAPVPAPAPAPGVPVVARPGAGQPVRVDTVPAQPVLAQPRPAAAGGAPSSAVVTATTRQDATNMTLAGGAIPTMSSGLLQLPEPPGLRSEHGLGPRVASVPVEAPLLAPETASGTAGSTPLSVVRAARTVPTQPAKPVGVVLFALAAAAGAAGMARLRMTRRSILASPGA
jgi:hypothetical protein